MNSSSGSRRLGLMLVGLVLLPLLALAWIIPCHADIHKCDEGCPHGDCCGGHSMPLLTKANPRPVSPHYCSPFHTAEEKLALKIFVSSIFRPPRA